MGHYDDSYALDEERRRAKIEKDREEIKTLLRDLQRKAVLTSIANKEQFRIKLNEALFWLDNE